MTKAKPVLGITGAFGYIGKRLIARLKKDDHFRRVVCCDILPPDENLPDRFESHLCDIRDARRLSSIFSEKQVKIIIHLAFIAQPTREPDFEYDVDVNGTRNVLDICKRNSVQKLVVAGSDCAYGFFEDTPDYLDESAPVRPTPGFPYAENKARVEQMVHEFSRQTPGCRTVILRPCMVIGPACANTTAASLQKKALIGVRGYDPIMQFVHEDDAADVFYQAAVRDLAGVFNLCADKGLRYTELSQFLGKPLIRVPARLIYPLVELLFRLRLLPFGKAQLDYIRYPLSMDNTRLLNDFGYQPRFTSRRAIASFLGDN